MKTVLIDNITCKIGENAVENWKMFDEAEKDLRERVFANASRV